MTRGAPSTHEWKTTLCTVPIPRFASAYGEIANPRNHELGTAHAHNALDDRPACGLAGDRRLPARFRLVRLSWLLLHVLLNRGGNGGLELRLFLQSLLRCVLLTPCLRRWAVANAVRLTNREFEVGSTRRGAWEKRGCSTRHKAWRSEGVWPHLV